MVGVKQIVGKDSHYKLFWSGNDNATGGLDFFRQGNGGRRCLRRSVSQTGSFSFV